MSSHPPSSSSQYGPAEPDMHSFVVHSTGFVVDSYLQPLKPVGSGAYGVVCSALNTRTNERVAIKKISNAFDDLVDSKRILRELKLLRHFDHENVVGLRDLVQPLPNMEFEDVYMVLDFMETDLHKIIYSRNKLTDEHVQYFVYQTLKALKYIHSANVIHRDLKPSNILLNGNCDLKICDFGLARGVSDDDDYTLTEYVVTRWYRAPEVMCSCQDYDEKIDVWSVACIMAELLGRKPLFAGDDYIHQMNLIFGLLGTPTEEDMEFITNAKALQYIRSQRRRAPVSLAQKYPTANPMALDLLGKMLTFDPRKRISVDEALEHPYLRGLHNPRAEVTCDRPFDFEFEQIDMTKPVLQAFMMEEICKFRPYLVSSPAVAPYLQACARYYQTIRDQQRRQRDEAARQQNAIMAATDAVGVVGAGSGGASAVQQQYAAAMQYQYQQPATAHHLQQQPVQQQPVAQQQQPAYGVATASVAGEVGEGGADMMTIASPQKEIGENQTSGRTVYSA